MMTLVPAMLRSLVDADGEALVIHAGEKPYVVASSGQVELANKPLTMDAVKGIISQLLPRDVLHALDEFGAVQHEIVSPPEFPRESFTLVAARGNDDMWVEIRRRKVEAPALPEMPVEPVAQRLAIAATVRRGTEAGRRRRPADEPPPPPSQHAPVGPVVVPAPAVVLQGRGSDAGIHRLLRIAAARGASALYLSSQAPPAVRVDGEVRVVEGEPSSGSQDLEWLLTAVPGSQHEGLRSGQVVDWTSDIDGVGRVRCTTFQDERGPGAVFRLMPARATSSEQLGLSRTVESLAFEPEGLVLIAGQRLSGKSTMISALVDLMNRRRHVRVITIENEVSVVHAQGTSVVSQREVRGGPDDMARAALAALREDPDVLVIESMQSPRLVDIALEAAGSGRLVLATVIARGTTSALAQIVNSCPAETRQQAQLALARHLRGAVAQVLLPQTGGGRVAAREVLLNTPSVASAIAEGRLSQLSKASDAGPGMQRLNDALAGLVQRGTVEPIEAYRQAADRTDLLARLKRLGVDTSAIDGAGGAG
jgi:twitching motility protein PilT